jgi:[acyl-carrier-protein] S-malonyltransferase
MAGHSVGEYAALASAGIVSIKDGSRLVQKRGDLMARSGNLRKGTMAAVLGLERDALEQICRRASAAEEVVVIANDNCPGQLVISGDVEAVGRASAEAQAQGAKRVLPLNVSGAFHSPLMDEATQALGQALHQATFGTEPDMPIVFANVTAEPVDLASAWPVLLETQLKLPVRWTETVQNMRKEGIRGYVECGVGEVLSGLIRRIDPEAATVKASDPESVSEAAAKIREVEVRA